jgi:SAM-dependent methyltransferase
VGCGNGDFLELASHVGWTTQGLDSDDKAVAVAKSRGLDVLLGDLESLQLQPESFDAICLSHVLEHVHDPVSTLVKCYSLLRCGGTLWVETPNLQSLGHRSYGRNWRGLEVPRHLVLFTAASLKTILKEAGFSNFEMQPWRPTCWYMFAESEAIAASEGSYSARRLRLLLRACSAEFKARQQVAVREFLTVQAKKAL